MPQYTVTSTRTFKQVVTYRVNAEDEDTAYGMPGFEGPDHPDVLEILEGTTQFYDEFVDAVIPVN